jgi:hypothetical protein
MMINITPHTSQDIEASAAVLGEIEEEEEE